MSDFINCTFALVVIASQFISPKYSLPLISYLLIEDLANLRGANSSILFVMVISYDVTLIIKDALVLTLLRLMCIVRIACLAVEDVNNSSSYLWRSESTLERNY